MAPLRRSHPRLPGVLLLLALLPVMSAAEAEPGAPAPAAPVATPAADAPRPAPTVTLDDVLAGVTAHYPPFLAALIEQDIANGRARQARGAFDTSLNVGGTFRPDGYYDGSTAGAYLDQPLSGWGGSIFGGYRYSTGFLPSYNKERTPEDGQIVLGLKIPLLRDGAIDTRRVRLKQAELDEQLADPFIQRQRLDSVRAATIAYYTWVAMGHRLALAEQLLRIAEARDAIIAEQIAQGATAPIVRVDNNRLVLVRRIGLAQATRRFEGAAIELSLFYRDAACQPVRLGRERLPAAFGDITTPDEKNLVQDIAGALERRPEMRRIQLTLEKVRLEERLADNALLPDLSVGAQVNQSPSGEREKDIEATEIEAKVELKISLDRNEAKGRLQAAKAQIARLQYEIDFSRDRVTADVRDGFSALHGAVRQIAETDLNVTLAEQLREAEVEKFRQGAVDLLALQIREQAAFEARVMDVEARAEYFRALAHYRAATAFDAKEAKAVTPPAAPAPAVGAPPGKP